MAQVETHIPDVRAVEQLTCLTDISRLLHETLATERGLEAELDQLLSRRGNLEQNLLALHSNGREVCIAHIQLLPVAEWHNCFHSMCPHTSALQTLEVVKAEAETLANSVKQTSNLSESVSKKVRELDTAQSRVNNTLESIDYIVNRTNAVDGVQQALQNEDYEAAAEYVDTLLQSEDKYGKAHQDSHVKQSEQQSRVWLLYMALHICSIPCQSRHCDCRRLQKRRKRSRGLFRTECRMLSKNKIMTQLSALSSCMLPSG